MTNNLGIISSKRLFASLHDIAMAGAAMSLALATRYSWEQLPPNEHFTVWVGAYMIVCGIVFQLFGLGRGMWQFASITDLRSIVLAATISNLTFLLIMFIATRLDDFPRSAVLISWFILVVLLGAPRLAYRALKDGGLMGVRPRDLPEGKTESVLLIGSASEADTVIKSYGLERSRRVKVHGIVDSTNRKQGREVRGIPIIGAIDELDEIVARLSRGGVSIRGLIMAAARGERETIQPLANVAAKLGLPLRRVSAAPLIGTEPNLEDVTLEDLLGRPPVRLDFENIRALVSERVVLITGAGGSIGSEIVRQVAALDPSRVIIIDSCEYALYEIDQALSRDFSKVDKRAVIADVRDHERLRQIMNEERPWLVFHAAALKHVPLVEDNIREGILTNVIGTRNIADAAVEAHAYAVVVISTDKAIRPTSIMGATKRAAEAYCQALDVSGVQTRFITVRFGNVLGSTGSVVPLFKRQILAGGPVTVTHPDMKRYFMTIAEATELVLQAAANGVARLDDRGRIFVLDMGSPVRILDLARTMIALAGLRPDIDIPIAYSGLRPGEKLFEELFDKDEATIPSGADGVFIASARFLRLETVKNIVARLEIACKRDEPGAIRALLKEIVPEMAADALSPAPPEADPEPSRARPALSNDSL
jgi:FlaA1/EpsC-like NDP-sugar epimerase